MVLCPPDSAQNDAGTFELFGHIKNLVDEINNFMNPEEKKADAAIQDIVGIGNASAQIVISVIGTDIEFPTDARISSWAGIWHLMMSKTAKSKGLIQGS